METPRFDGADFPEMGGKTEGIGLFGWPARAH